MKIDLSKCKTGDKLIRRDGKEMTYINKVKNSIKHKLKYWNDGSSSLWTNEGHFFENHNKNWVLGSDIIKIKHISVNEKKLIKVYIYCESEEDWYWISIFNNIKCSSNRSVKSYYSAIRSVRNFFRKLGYNIKIHDGGFRLSY